MPASSEIVRAQDPCTIVIFGASGDLAARKLIPALSHLAEYGWLPDCYAIVGFARREKSDEQFREEMRAALLEHAKEDHDENPQREEFLRTLFYQVGDLTDDAAYRRLRDRLRQLESALNLPGHRVYYLAVAPEYFGPIVRHLQAAGLIHQPEDPVWTRVVIEKPFGRDRRSAQELNATLRQILDERQIYRIDHYLGKETVQNILSFRFGNSIFEPLFNQKYVDHVQITVAETLGMEGRRGGYYETAGALRDMVQNHMLQLLSLIAMEPPSVFEPDALHDEKSKLLRALPPLKTHQVARQTVRGQYGPGTMNGQPVKGYRQEEGVAPDSTVETYVALRLQIENWRWMGVPFFLRTGKRLARRVSEIVVSFKSPPLHLFTSVRRPSERCDVSAIQPNALVFHIQPDEGISLLMAAKEPGMQFRLQPVSMDFLYRQAFQARAPEAYERLLLDVLRGDSTLFTRSDTLDLAWRFVTSILDGWAVLPPPVFPNYAPGSAGPAEADELFYGLRACWRPL